MIRVNNLLPKAVVENLKDQSVSGVVTMESYENVLFALDSMGDITTHPRELLPYLDPKDKIFIITDDCPHTPFWFTLKVRFEDASIEGQVSVQGNIFYLTEALFKTIQMWSANVDRQLLQSLFTKLAAEAIPFNDSYPVVKIEL